MYARGSRETQIRFEMLSRRIFESSFHVATFENDDRCNVEESITFLKRWRTLLGVNT